MANLVHIGRDATRVTEDLHGIELEGTCRLAPGRTVLIAGLDAVPAARRPAYVVAWWLVRVRCGVPQYRGYCRWT